MDNWNRNDRDEYTGVTAQRRNRRRTNPEQARPENPAGAAAGPEKRGPSAHEASGGTGVPEDYKRYMRPETPADPDGEAAAEPAGPEESARPAVTEKPAEPEKPAESEESAEPQLSEVEKFFNQEKADTIIHDKNNKLKFYEFENEIFEPQYQNGNLINIHANGNYIDRYFYNDNYQLVKKENWNIPSVQGAKLEKTEKYEYYPDSNVISKKTITTLESQENLTYSETSKILTSEKYAIAEEKNQITSKRKLSYDNEDRLISDSLTEYFYKDKEYKELDYSFTKKYDYAYNEGEIPPDFKYYENGVLKMLNKYSSEKGKYVSEIFFDKTFSVKTYYENDVRVKDVFYNGGKVTREKLYDKMD